MGNWTGLHTLGLLAIGALVFFYFFWGLIRTTPQSAIEFKEKNLMQLSEVKCFT